MAVGVWIRLWKILNEIPGDQQKPHSETEWKTIPELWEEYQKNKNKDKVDDANDYGTIDGEPITTEYTGDFPTGFGFDNSNVA